MVSGCAGSKPKMQKKLGAHNRRLMTEEPTNETKDSAGRKKPSRAIQAGSLGFRYVMKLVVVLVFVSVGLFAGGFLNFARTVSDYTPPQTIEIADGIVVLTGGAARISTGLSLLEMKKAKRLLISGVNRQTNMNDLRKLNSKYLSLFDCCVDKEAVAADTIGNARESKKWADENNYKSLTIVTSDYHMPRSLLEFRQQMPHMKLQAYPIAYDKLKQEGWWQDTATLRLILSEYSKYLVAGARRYLGDSAYSALRANLYGG